MPPPLQLPFYPLSEVCFGTLFLIYCFIYLSGSGKPSVKTVKTKICSTSISLVAPLGGAEELLEQHLAPCRGSEPQTLGKAVLCPYKAAIHPLPSSSPAPFLCLSQTWGIFTESASASLPFLIRSSACCQYFYPAGQWSISLLSDETNRWMTGVNYTLVQMDGNSKDSGTQTALPRRLLSTHTALCNDTDFYHVSQATHDVQSTWEQQ